MSLWVRSFLFMAALNFSSGYGHSDDKIVDSLLLIKEAMESGSGDFGLVAERIVQALPLAAEGENLEEAIKFVLSDHNNIELRPIASGMGGDTVLSIYEGGRFASVVKVYKLPAVSFVEDFWAQAAALKLGLVAAAVPELERVAKISVAGEELLLILQRAQEGVPIRTLFDSVSGEDDPLKRREHYGRLLRALTHLGAAIGEFHRSSFSRVGGLSPHLNEEISSAIGQALRAIRDNPSLNFDERLIAQALERLSLQIKGASFDWTYIHGDAHYGNFLYDEMSDTLSIIDLGCGAKMINSDFKGEGTPWIDLVKLIEQIRLSARLCTEEEIVEMMDAFMHGYGFFSLKDPRYRYCFIHYACLGVNWYLKAKDQLPPSMAGWVEEALHSRFDRACLSE